MKVKWKSVNLHLENKRCGSKDYLMAGTFDILIRFRKISKAAIFSHFRMKSGVWHPTKTLEQQPLWASCSQVRWVHPAIYGVHQGRLGSYRVRHGHEHLSLGYLSDGPCSNATHMAVNENVGLLVDPITSL